MAEQSSTGSSVNASEKLGDEELQERLGALKSSLDKSTTYISLVERALNRNRHLTPTRTAVVTKAEKRRRDDATEAVDGNGVVSKRLRLDDTVPPSAGQECVPQPWLKQPNAITGIKLEDHQLAGVERLDHIWINGAHGILADGQRQEYVILQMIAFFAHLQQEGVSGHALILCPLSGLHNWTEYFAKFAPTLPVCIYHRRSPKGRAELGRKKGKGKEDSPYPIMLMTNEMLAVEHQYLTQFKWDCIVVDEGHWFHNVDCKLLHAIKKCEHATRFILTETYNNIPQLWSLLNFILPVAPELDHLQKWFYLPTSIPLPSNELGPIFCKLHELLEPFSLRLGQLKVNMAHSLPSKQAQLIERQKEVPHDQLNENADLSPQTARHSGTSCRLTSGIGEGIGKSNDEDSKKALASSTFSNPPVQSQDSTKTDGASFLVSGSAPKPRVTLDKIQVATPRLDKFGELKINLAQALIDSTDPDLRAAAKKVILEVLQT